MIEGSRKGHKGFLIYPKENLSSHFFDLPLAKSCSDAVFILRTLGVTALVLLVLLALLLHAICKGSIIFNVQSIPRNIFNFLCFYKMFSIESRDPLSSTIGLRSLIIVHIHFTLRPIT